MNMKMIDEVASELDRNYEPLKAICQIGTDWDAYLPSLSASLEYLKYCVGTSLPTQFMEAEMDFFGAHSFDRPSLPYEDPGKVAKGPHHYEWRIA
jgi:6-phosphogluconate dehydrogenase